VDRWACVDLPALPLQLLLNDHPEWTRLPCAVVEDDAPQALVQFVNARAYAQGVRAGQRYAAALGVASGLRAGAVPPLKVVQHTQMLTDRLRRYSPHVEPSTDAPGVFWLDARGLHWLYPSLREWAQAVRLDMRAAGFRAAVVVGCTRFGVYALAKCQSDIVIYTDAADERAAVERVPLSCAALDPDALARLAALGIDTVGDFLRLPAAGIRQRFGAAAHALHQLAAGHAWAPLAPVPADEPQTRVMHFDAPEANVERLIFVVKRLLDSLTAALASHAHAVAALVLDMTLDDRSTCTARVQPAASTLDAAQLLTLVRLRLSALQLPAGIVTLRITAAACPATSEQQRLFAPHTQRDPALANHALARLRAEFGEHAVVRARLGHAHLPHAQFEWEPLDAVPPRTSAAVVTARPLVRRIYAHPIPLASNFSLPPHPHTHTTSGALSDDVVGPYVLSGGWWGIGTRRRDYYFVRTADGRVQWVYYDHRQRRFFLQGCVE